MSQELEHKEFYLNPVAQLFLQSKANIKALVAGRGFGKSFDNGIEIAQKVSDQPRSRGLFLGLTYTQILSNTLLPMKSAWEWFGYFEGIHYVVGKKPPEHFIKPYQSPNRHENVISWWNGTCVIMGSFDRPQLLRGGSNDWVIVDEALLINKEKYDQIVIPSLRGSHPLLNNSPGHLQQIFTTSMPHGNFGKWLFELEEQARDPANDVYYIEGTSYHNRVILTEKVLENWRRTMPKLVFAIEVLNKRVKQYGNLFYPSLRSSHYYSDSYNYNYIDTLTDQQGYDLSSSSKNSRWDQDCDPKKPLNLSFDFGAFNCVTIDQEHGNETRILNFMFVTHPEIIDDLVDKFDKYYQHHENTTLYLWGDKSGNKREGNSKLTYFQQIRQRLESKSKKWRVILKTVGDVEHIERHRFINKLLRGEENHLPSIRINQNNCKDLIIALENAGMSGIKKDKSSEKSSIVRPEHATHGTDAFDYRLYHGYKKREHYRSEIPQETVSFGKN